MTQNYFTRLVRRSFGSAPVIRPVIPPMFSPLELPLTNAEHTFYTAGTTHSPWREAPLANTEHTQLRTVSSQSSVEPSTIAMQESDVQTLDQNAVANDNWKIPESTYIRDEQPLSEKLKPKNQGSRKHESISDSAYDEVLPLKTNTDIQHLHNNGEERTEFRLSSNPTTHRPEEDLSNTKLKVGAATRFYSPEKAAETGMNQTLPSLFVTDQAILTTNNYLNKVDIEPGKVFKPSEMRISRDTHSNNTMSDDLSSVSPAKELNVGIDSLDHNQRQIISTSSKVVSSESKPESLHKLEGNQPAKLTTQIEPEKEAIVAPGTKVNNSHPTSENQHPPSERTLPPSVVMLSNQKQFNSEIGRTGKGISESVPEPVVKVVIGRVEVRAFMQQEQKPRQAQTKPVPKLTLDGYLKSRKGGSS